MNKRLRLNKVFAIFCIIIGLLSTRIDGDYTAALILWGLALGLVLAKENVIDI